MTSQPDCSTHAIIAKNVVKDKDVTPSNTIGKDKSIVAKNTDVTPQNPAGKIIKTQKQANIPKGNENAGKAKTTTANVELSSEKEKAKTTIVDLKTFKSKMSMELEKTREIANRAIKRL